jgi:hypothetical protein
MAAPNCFFSSGFNAEAVAALGSGLAGSALAEGLGSLAQPARERRRVEAIANRGAARIAGRVWISRAEETRPYRSRSGAFRGKEVLMRLGTAMRRGVFVFGFAFVFSALFVLCAAGRASAEPEEKAGAPTKTDPPPRPPPLGAGDPIAPPPRRRSIEIGVDVALVSRPSSIEDAEAPKVSYDPAIGYGVHGRVEILRHLRFTAYFVSSAHDVDLPPGALGQAGALALDSVSTFSFGARLMPTWPFSDRLRSWVSVGAGWGRLEFGRMEVTDPGQKPFTVRERATSFVEIPLGVGTSFEIIPRWLSLEVEATGAFVVGQQGSSVEAAQAVDAAGKIRSIGSFPRLDASFVQTVGLSLLL